MDEADILAGSILFKFLNKTNRSS